MKNNINYVRLAKDEVSTLKDLWIELNDYHIPIVTTFKERFENVSFERHLDYLLSFDVVFSYVALDTSQIIGFIIIICKQKTAEIDSIFVKEEYRNQGIGNGLMTRALKEVVGIYDEIIIRVAEGNEQPFHSQNHFKKRYTLFQYDYDD